MSDQDEELPAEDSIVEDVLDYSTDGAEPDETPDIEETGEVRAEDTPAEGRVRGPDGKLVKVAAPEGEAEGEVGDEAEAAPNAVPDAPKGRPVQLKADGALYDLPGAVQRDDGVVELDAQGFDLVHRYVGRALVSEKKIERLSRENAELAQRTTAEAEYVKQVGEQYTALALMAQEDPEGAMQILQGFVQQLPALQAQMERDHWKKLAEQQQRGAQPDPQVQQAEREQAFGISMKETWDTALQQSWAKGLAPEDVTQLANELWAVRDSFLVVATRDDPDNDIRRGDWLFNEPKMVEAVKNRAEYIGKLRQTSTRVAAAAQKNAGTNGKVVAPPMGAGKRVSNTTSAPAPKAKTREDWQKQNLW